jgi:excisionase family DNA binding protein
MSLLAEFPSDLGRSPAQPTERYKLLFTIKECAYALALSKRTIEKLVATGALKTRRVGRRVLIHRRELENFARHDHPVHGGQ